MRLLGTILRFLRLEVFCMDFVNHRKAGYMVFYQVFLLSPLQCTAKTKCRKSETNIPREGISGSQSQFPHSCVCEWIIYSHDGSAFSVGGNMWTDPGNIWIAHRHMNVEIGAEAAQFPEKEYINGIAVAVCGNWTVETKRFEEIKLSMKSCRGDCECKE